MKNFTFVDETLDLNRSQSYKLSIQLQLDGFSFSITDVVRNKYILLKHYDLSEQITFDEKGEKLNQIINTDKYLQHSFKKVDCLSVDPKSIFVPAPLFDDKQLKKYFEFNHQMDELEEIHYHHIEQLDAYNVFTIPNPISNSLFDKFNKVQMYHYTFPMVFYHLNFIQTEKTHVALNLYDSFIELMVIGNENLLFSNTFTVQNNEDIIYYTLYVYKHLKLKPENTDLYISGSRITDDSLLPQIKQYIKKVHQLKPPKEFTYSYTFKKETINYFTNLFRLNLCV